MPIAPLSIVAIAESSEPGQEGVRIGRTDPSVTHTRPTIGMRMRTSRINHADLNPPDALVKLYMAASS